jgi:energy-coupling factor transporter ATP-binding protein EcfA2
MSKQAAASKTRRRAGAKPQTPPSPPRLVATKLGPIDAADVEFGDLTVVVGPQATGKSIFLQTLKLLLDRDHIHDTFRRHSVSFGGDTSAFLGGYFGKGMAAAWSKDSALRWNGQEQTLPGLAQPSRSKVRHERLFFIPAQRVMSLASGVPQNFRSFSYGDPYTLRYFAEAVRVFLEEEFGTRGELFPQSNRLNDDLRAPISTDIYGEGKLSAESKDFSHRMELRVKGHDEGLPYLAWSAGQREFTPLLLGLYWLCPVAVSRRRTGGDKEEAIEWVVIEEPEMGLHPKGIVTVLLLVLELMRRGYRVVLSTHSPVVLDLVWALRELKNLDGSEGDVRSLFGLAKNGYTQRLARTALTKDYRVHFFDRHQRVKDISGLDPGALSPDEAEWGGLVGFASRVGEVLTAAVNRQEARSSAREGRDVATSESP